MMHESMGIRFVRSLVHTQRLHEVWCLVLVRLGPKRDLVLRENLYMSQVGECWLVLADLVIVYFLFMFLFVVPVES